MADGVGSGTLVAELPERMRPASRSLWAETFRRFRRHRLATFGAVVLLIMVIAVLVGPFVYRVPIDEIDFKAKLRGPTWAARTCWPACSTAAASRWRSGSRPC